MQYTNFVSFCINFLRQFEGEGFYEIKKVISSLLVAAMATTLLAGCGGSNDKPAASADNTPADNTASNDAADAPAADTPDTTPAEDTADDAAPVEEQTLKVAAFEGRIRRRYVV